MRILALDISTKTGWALLEGEQGSVPRVVKSGRVVLDGKVRGYAALSYPWDYLKAIEVMAHEIIGEVVEHDPDIVVIEETNGSRSRYTQKILEWLHMGVLRNLDDLTPAGAPRFKKYGQVNYVNTSDWRKAVGATLTKEDKKLNVQVRKLKKAGDKAALKTLGVRGKFGKKHAALRYVNNTFGLDLRMRDNDIADAICLGTAWFLGAPICDGN